MSRPLITVKTLIGQSRERGEIELPANALVTPAAADWLRSASVRVRRTDASNAVSDDGAVVYVVGDARDAMLQTLLPALERQNGQTKFLPCNGHLAGLLDAVRETCDGLSECTRARGIVLVRNGAIVNCVANKYAKVRAAIAAKPSGLLALLRTLGVNLLIVETERLSLRQVQATISDFLAGTTSVDPIVESALAGLPASNGESPACGCPTGT